MKQQLQRGEVKEALAGQIQRLWEILASAAAFFPTGNDQLAQWSEILQNLERHLDENRFRIAVVGTVKSGKSTLLNALVGRDLLRRGAGIVTAMITRVEPGPIPKATLVFKDWEELNGELNTALSFFPSPLLLTRQEPFDLRAEDDRRLLAEILAQVDRQQLLHQDILDKNFILIQSFLNGYPQVAGLLAAGPPELKLEGDQVLQHQQLVAQEASAVFLKDVRLTVPISWAVSGLELGDCQGSDSPIPQHLAQVQQYLIGADLVLYVISSRVGLRQADYKFLADLQRLRLAENCLFVINLDLGELESLAETERLLGRWRQELAFFQPQPALFAFSALDWLLDQLRRQGQPLNPKDLGKLLTWEADAPLTEYSRQEASRFTGYLRQVVQERQVELLWTSNLGQLQLVAQGARERLALQEKLWQQDLATCQDICRRLRERRQPFTNLLHSLHQALQGAVAELQRTLRPRIDRFCDFNQGPVGPQVAHFIQAYEPDLERLAPGDQLSAFLPGLYQLYQSFQQHLLQFITTEINLVLMEFIREQEDWVVTELQRVLEPLLVPLQDALRYYHLEIEQLGLGGEQPQIKLAPWKKGDNRQPPLFSLELSFDLRLRSEALFRFGLQLVGEAWTRLSRLWRRPSDLAPQDRLRQALQQALAVIKRKTAQELAVHLKSYAESLKFRYFFPLMEEMATYQEKALRTELAAVLVDLEGLSDILAARGGPKSSVAAPA